MQKLLAEHLEQRELLSISPAAPQLPNPLPGWNSCLLASSSSSTVKAAIPSVALAALAPSTVAGSTASLSVLGTHSDGESSLIYTCTASSLPGGASAPTFSENGTNAAKNTTVAFSKAGIYIFSARITDIAGHSVTSTVRVNVSQVVTQINVTPAVATLPAGGKQQFLALGLINSVIR